jgi:hypothetical protein
MRRVIFSGLICMLLASLGASALSASQSAAAERTQDGPHWVGPDGETLPFQTADDALEFLRTADITSVKRLTIGVNATFKMTLERNGVVAHASFRTVNQSARRKNLATGTVLNFKDSYKSEVSAYELSRLLDMHEVPPAVLRTWDDKDGSLQLWIEQSQMEIERLKAHQPLPNGRVWLQLFDMRVFDNVIGNIDRNQGNILYDRLGRLWLIDHTRSFSRSPRLPDAGSLTRCSISLWNALHHLEMGQIRSHLSDTLYKTEMKALLQRRDTVIRILQAKIDQRGRGAVLFDLDTALGTIQVLPSAPATSSPPSDDGIGAPAARD